MDSTERHGAAYSADEIEDAELQLADLGTPPVVFVLVQSSHRTRNGNSRHRVSFLAVDMDREITDVTLFVAAILKEPTRDYTVTIEGYASNLLHDLNSRVEGIAFRNVC